MTQKTAKTVLDVLDWIETTPHHIASAEDPKFFVLKGHHDTLRIPTAIHDKMRKLVKPGGFFDQRMYRCTPSGRVRRWRDRKAAEARTPPPATAAPIEGSV